MLPASAVACCGSCPIVLNAMITPCGHVVVQSPSPSPTPAIALVPTENATTAENTTFNTTEVLPVPADNNSTNVTIPTSDGTEVENTTAVVLPRQGIDKNKAYFNILEAANATEDLTEFYKLAAGSGIAALRNASTVATVFAPSNAAIAQALATLNGENLTQTQLQYLLQYHVTPGAALVASRLVSLTTGKTFRAGTLLAGGTLNITQTG